MILADKIIELRKRNGWSQEELAEKLNVSRQSISKWEGAQSIPDMNRIIKMSEIFGVSTDFLLKDEETFPEEAAVVSTSSGTEDLPVRSVSMEDAVAFLSYRSTIAARIALGVMMCILSPVLIVVLSVCQDQGMLHMSEGRVVGIGILVLFLLVGGAVALFVTSALAGHPYEFFEKEAIDTAYGVDGMTRERRDRYTHTYTVWLAIGIVLCVVSVIPIFIGMILFGENELAAGIGTACLLVMVAIGVYMIVRTSIIWDSFKMLLQEGDYTLEQKEENKKNDLLATIYWCAAIALYLGLSFITQAWDRTWIIWPIAGVLYGLVVAVAKAVRKK